MLVCELQGERYVAYMDKIPNTKGVGITEGGAVEALFMARKERQWVERYYGWHDTIHLPCIVGIDK